MPQHFTLAQSNALLPLIRAIAREIVERRQQRRRIRRMLTELRESGSPEGMDMAIRDLEDRMDELDGAIADACHELVELGVRVLRIQPLTVHIPGTTRTEEIVFCWQEGEDTIQHGHLMGEEDDPRRPLRIRTTKGFFA